VALSRQEVDDFMAAEKVVPATRIGGAPATMTWRKQPEGVLWQGPIEVGVARVGQITLYANAREERNWTFKLSLQGEEVYQWHIRSFNNHSNPPIGVRPDGFPRVVRNDHEHVWIEGLDCACALPIDVSDRQKYEHVFAAFCERTNTRFDAAFAPPPIQLAL
jgi:hypothetical protein